MKKKIVWFTVSTITVLLIYIVLAVLLQGKWVVEELNSVFNFDEVCMYLGYASVFVGLLYITAYFLNYISSGAN